MTRKGQEGASVVLVMICFLIWVMVREVYPVCENYLTVHIWYMHVYVCMLLFNIHKCMLFLKKAKKFKTPYCSIKVPLWSDLSQYISHNVLTPTSTPPVPYISYPKRSWSNCRKASKSKFLFLLMSFLMQYTLPPPHKCTCRFLLQG